MKGKGGGGWPTLDLYLIDGRPPLDPWRLARRGCKPFEHCEEVITKESIRVYYSLHPTWMDV